ncbi:MAG: S1 family peptidase [Pseudonocardiaceae bacterium]
MSHHSRRLLILAAVLATTNSMAFGSATAEIRTDGLVISSFNNGSGDHISETNVAPDDKVSPRIIGGSPASTNTYPWVVIVGKGCGGALIAPTKVLTAGHCADKATTIIVGRDKNHGSGGRQFTVTARSKAPHFQTISESPDLHFDDVAVLTLDKAVSGVTPVNFAGPDDGGLYQPGNTGTVFGWGAHSDGHLAKATVPVVSDSCFDMGGPYKNDKQSPAAMKRSLFCAGDTMHDACSGDSGGPLLINGKLAGIVSGGGTNGDCAQKGKPGTYSRVSNYSKWIGQHL